MGFSLTSPTDQSVRRPRQCLLVGTDPENEDFIKSAPDTILVIGCSSGVALLPRLLKHCRKVNPDCAIININPHEDCIELLHHYLPLSASVALTAFDSLFS